MNNFDLYNPTKLIFGEGEISKLKQEIPQNSKVLLLYGGGSIKRNGIYEEVKQALADFEVLEFGGIPANPEYHVLLEALEIIKKEQIDFLLAVGGGSVIDGTKFLSSAALFDGDTPWDILSNRLRTEVGMPFGTVLTLPATGSEMNSGAVITNKETNEKLGMGGPGLFPKFSILDPNVIKSIPKRQLANGLVDSFTHVLEQYMTYPIKALLQDRIAEGILQTIVEISPDVMKNDPEDYKTKTNFMWCCTMALNGLIQKGVPTDWAIHAMGHELTSQYGIDHARTLSIITGSHYRYNFEAKKEKLAQYAERVWSITEGTIEEKAKQGILKTEEFFKSLDMPISLSEVVEKPEGTAEKVQATFEERGWLVIGDRGQVKPEDAKAIVEMSY